MPSATRSNAPMKPKSSPFQPLWSSGQNTYKSGLCIATELDGSPCMEPHAHKYVPYCKRCMKSGDPSVEVVPHPRFGRMLVSKRMLPKNYKLGLWGDATNGPMNECDEEWGFETADGLNINPCKYSASFVQFSQCPGPHEVKALNYANPYVYIEPKPRGNKPLKEKLATMMFQTTQAIQKGGQLTMMYGEGTEKDANEFFQSLGLTRCDVYTDKHPTILKKGYTVKDLIFVPPKARSLREKETILDNGGKKGTIIYQDKQKYSDDGSKRVSGKKTVPKKAPVTKGAGTMMKKAASTSVRKTGGKKK